LGLTIAGPECWKSSEPLNLIFLLVTEALSRMVFTADSAALWSGGESTVSGPSAAWSHLSDSSACDCCDSVGSAGCWLCGSLLRLSH